MNDNKWLEERRQTKKQIINNAADAVIRWLKQDEKNGGYWLELIMSNSHDHLIQAQHDESLFDAMGAVNWLALGNRHESLGWWVWIFDSVFERLHEAESHNQ